MVQRSMHVDARLEWLDMHACMMIIDDDDDDDDDAVKTARFIAASNRRDLLLCTL